MNFLRTTSLFMGGVRRVMHYQGMTETNSVSWITEPPIILDLTSPFGQGGREMRIQCTYVCKKCGGKSSQIFEPKELCRNINGKRDYIITTHLACEKCGELPVAMQIIKTSLREEIQHWIKLYIQG